MLEEFLGMLQGIFPSGHHSRIRALSIPWYTVLALEVENLFRAVEERIPTGERWSAEMRLLRSREAAVQGPAARHRRQGSEGRALREVAAAAREAYTRPSLQEPLLQPLLFAIVQPCIGALQWFLYSYCGWMLFRRTPLYILQQLFSLVLSLLLVSLVLCILASLWRRDCAICMDSVCALNTMTNPECGGKCCRSCLRQYLGTSSAQTLGRIRHAR